MGVGVRNGWNKRNGDCPHSHFNLQLKPSVLVFQELLLEGGLNKKRTVFQEFTITSGSPSQFQKVSVSFVSLRLINLLYFLPGQIVFSGSGDFGVEECPRRGWISLYEQQAVNVGGVQDGSSHRGGSGGD